MKLIFLHLVFAFIICISCNSLLTPTVEKNHSYLITSNTESYVYIVTRILHERTENLLLERIDYKLHQFGEDSNKTLTSYVKYRRIKKGDNYYRLKRIEGSNEISKGIISFSWSYATDNSIYIYLKEGLQIKKIEDQGGTTGTPLEL